MNIKMATQNYFSTPAHLAGTLITFSRLASLLSPIRSVIRNLATFPSGMVLANDLNASPSAIALIRAKGTLTLFKSALNASANRPADKTIFKSETSSVCRVSRSAKMNLLPFVITTAVTEMRLRTFHFIDRNHDRISTKITRAKDAIKRGIVFSLLPFAYALGLTRTITKVQGVGLYLKGYSFNCIPAVATLNGYSRARFTGTPSLPSSHTLPRTKVGLSDSTSRQGETLTACFIRAIGFDIFSASQGVNLLEGLALVRPAQSLQRLCGPLCILSPERRF